MVDVLMVLKAWESRINACHHKQRVIEGWERAPFSRIQKFSLSSMKRKDGCKTSVECFRLIMVTKNKSTKDFPPKILIFFFFPRPQKIITITVSDNNNFEIKNLSNSFRVVL